MKQIYRTYKFRIYPSKEQQNILARYFGSVRFVYNHFLSERKQQYEKTQHSDDYYKQAKSLTELKKQEEYFWLKEINSQTLQHALRHLETAYVNFFRGTAKFPNFKSKKNKNSFSVPHGSNSYEKQRRKVAKIYEKISSCRLDMQHKVSLDLIRKYDIICLEDLNIKGMVKNHRLAKAINDASWGQFVSMLTYKAELNDKQVVKIDRWYPSSKICHNCRWVNEGLKLSDRQWVCPQCGEIIDRDINAAKNILSEGIRKISVGHTDYTDGDRVRLDNKRQLMKSEGSPRF